MALFKVLKGNRSALSAQALHDGYAYFCVDDGSFHIDVTDSEGVLQRKQVNAKDAETLTGMTLEEIQKSISWDELNDRPFGHYPEIVVEWDNEITSGSIVLDYGVDSTALKQAICKISDAIPTLNQIKNSKTEATLPNGDKVDNTDPPSYQDMGDYVVLNAYCFIIRKANITLKVGGEYRVFPESGIYMEKVRSDLYYWSKITFPEEIVSLDETYIPDTIARTDIATTENNGLMSLEDKAKLDGIAVGADKTAIENSLTSTSASAALSAAQGKVLNDSKVDKVDGKGLSTNDFTTAEKNKLGDIEAEANKTVVDTELSLTSENPVQNKVIKAELDKKEASGTAASAVGNHNTNEEAHNDIRLLLSELNTKLNNFLDVDDTTKDELSEVIALIKANSDLIEGITTSKVNVEDIINNLTTNVANKPLSAAQGVELKRLIDALEAELDGHTHNYAGSSSAGGSANSAVKLDSSAGSAIQPVYFKDGKPVATEYTLEKSVPSDAKFTDTVYTHPSYTAKTGAPTANQTPKFGGTFTITQPVSDGTGHIVEMNSRTVTIPNAVASASANGLMSSADKVKVDALDTTYATIDYVDELVGDIETALAAI